MTGSRGWLIPLLPAPGSMLRDRFDEFRCYLTGMTTTTDDDSFFGNEAFRFPFSWQTIYFQEGSVQKIYTFGGGRNSFAVFVRLVQEMDGRRFSGERGHALLSTRNINRIEQHRTTGQ